MGTGQQQRVNNPLSNFRGRLYVATEVKPFPKYLWGTAIISSNRGQTIQVTLGDGLLENRGKTNSQVILGDGYMQ